MAMNFSHVREATVAKYTTVQNEGGRLVERNITFYNLDMIISVGCRVNSKQGTHFRKWASTVLKNHIIEGFTINKKRLQEKGLEKLEKALALIKKTTLSKRKIFLENFPKLYEGLISFVPINKLALSAKLSNIF